MISYQDTKKQIRDIQWVGDPFDVISKISKLVLSNQSQGRDLAIRALEFRERLVEPFREVLDEITLQAGLFPYVDRLDHLSARSAISHASHRAEGEMQEYVLHEAQSRILRRMVAGESIILSAPTSFGKSLLIDLLISQRDFQSIVLIVPTLALVEETRRRMTRFAGRYSIITTSTQDIAARNIFVLTQERYMSMQDVITHVDFFAIDEFYKLSLSEDGDRATVLNQALLRLSEFKCQFFMLGPSIKAIPSVVLSRLNCSFVIEDFQTVAVDLHQIAKVPNRDEALARILDKVEGQTLIYCQSPPSTRKLLKSYLEIRSPQETSDPELLDASKWTATNYHNDWLVSVALRYGIGVHHGRLPRSLGRFMIRAFEEGKISILLCTSTLIEGVNTAAKNVVVYDSKLNKKDLDFFTFNNIKGRSGRMFRHFIGNVFVFDNPPEEELPFVDIPAVNPSSLTPSSLLIQMQEEDVPAELRTKVSKLCDGTILPRELLVELSGIEPEFLLDAAKYLLQMDVRNLSHFSWSSRPQYEDILATSELIWSQMGGSTAAKHSSVYSAKMMTKMIWDLYKSRSVPVFRKRAILDQIRREVSPDDAVENILAFLRGWASFNYPKYLVSLDRVANYVLAKRGLPGCNYTFFAAKIEHLFQPSSFSALEEYGLPIEISENLINNRVFSENDRMDAVLSVLRLGDMSRYGRGIFERNMIKDFQSGIALTGKKPSNI